MQASIFDELYSYWSKPVEVRMVTSGEWKKEVLGRGDYQKPKKNETFTYQAIIWCLQHDVEVVDDNEADGVCIAEYASRVVRFV